MNGASGYAQADLLKGHNQYALITLKVKGADLQGYLNWRNASLLREAATEPLDMELIGI